MTYSDALTVKKASDCSILVVDDEESICEMLKDVLEPRYNVTTCKSGAEAFSYIDNRDFDVVITDLKLRDASGIEILSYAKGKDEYTEVIVITGYATLDSASLAINLGVYSYLMKPLSINEFLLQVEKAVATRLFHLKSLRLMQQSDYMVPEVKDHLFDITSLYFFLRKLMLSLEISEIMRITLEELNQKTGALFSVICVQLLGFSEIFAMPCKGDVDQAVIREILLAHQDTLFGIDFDKVKNNDIPLFVYHGKQGDFPLSNTIVPVSVPMMVTDRSIGTLTVFFDDQTKNTADQNQFLYVFSSIVSSIVEHGYSALQARQQAKTDSLTGIANHRSFHQTIDREIARTNRKKNKFSLILIDIDNFKKINDTYGHQVGDAVIIDLTRRIASLIRTGDVLARYGGEEFGIILPDTELHGAETLASRILVAVSSKPIVYSQYQISYTISLGLAVYDGNNAAKKDDLIAAADSALYASKHNGKNRYSIGTIAL